MIDESNAASFMNAWRNQYAAKFPTVAAASDFFITRPGLPATEIELPQL